MNFNELILRDNIAWHQKYWNRFITSCSTNMMISLSEVDFIVDVFDIKENIFISRPK